jgi:hypothetical protein
MRYKLKASLYPCKYGDEGPAGMDPSNWEKEQKKLERDIALQLRKVVRVPDAYARGKAAIMNTFHQYSHLGGTEDPTSPGVPSTDIMLWAKCKMHLGAGAGKYPYLYINQSTFSDIYLADPF